MLELWFGLQITVGSTAVLWPTVTRLLQAGFYLWILEGRISELGDNWQLVTDEPFEFEK